MCEYTMVDFEYEVARETALANAAAAELPEPCPHCGLDPNKCYCEYQCPGCGYEVRNCICAEEGQYATK